MAIINLVAIFYFMEELTRTSETEDNYLKKAQGILNRTAAFYGMMIDDVNAQMMAQYIIENRTVYSASTFRQYKAALVFYLKTYHYLYPDYENVINYLLGVDQSECAKKTFKTSQLRRKNFTIEQLNQLLFAISLDDSPYSQVTALWLQAGALTGLRPHEWKNVSIEQTTTDKMYLLVKNAKNTNGRAHGEYRHIEITDFSEKEMKILNDFMDIVSLYKNNSHNGFETLQRQCNDFLKYLNRRLINGKFNQEYFEKRKGSGIYQYRFDGGTTRITLYSARHFFSSQAKKSMLSLEEIAALMGHKTNKTASEHYGKSRYAQGGLKVKPLSVEVEKIEQKYTNTLTPPVQEQQSISPKTPTMRR